MKRGICIMLFIVLVATASYIIEYPRLQPKEEYRLSMVISIADEDQTTTKVLTPENNIYDFGKVVWPVNINFTICFNIDYYIDGQPQRSITLYPENNEYNSSLDLYNNGKGLRHYTLEDKNGKRIKSVPDRNIERLVDEKNYFYQISGVGKHYFEFYFLKLQEYGIKETSFYLECEVLEEEGKEGGAIMVIDESDADYTVVEKKDGERDLYILNKYNGEITSFPRFAVYKKNEENNYDLENFIVSIYGVYHPRKKGEGKMELYCKRFDENFEYNVSSLPEEKGTYLCRLYFKDSSQYKSIVKEFYVMIK